MNESASLLRRKLQRLALRWLLLPLVAAALLLVAGLHLGARNPDAWYTHAARWLGGVLAG